MTLLEAFTKAKMNHGFAKYLNYAYSFGDYYGLVVTHTDLTEEVLGGNMVIVNKLTGKTQPIAVCPTTMNAMQKVADVVKIFSVTDDPKTAIAHYGVTGMKWGVRRYQERNGDLTSAGKKRYGSKDDNRYKAKEYSSKAKLVKRFGENVNRLSDKGINTVANFNRDANGRTVANALIFGAIGAAVSSTVNTSKGKALVEHLLENPDIADLSYKEVSAIAKARKLKHDILSDIWDETKVVRDATGKFAKQAGEAIVKTTDKAVKTVSKAADDVGKAAVNTFNGITKSVKDSLNDVSKQFEDYFDRDNPKVIPSAMLEDALVTSGNKHDGTQDVLELLFYLAGGLPGWVLAKLIEMFSTGGASQAEIQAAIDAMTSDNLRDKVAAIDTLIENEKRRTNQDKPFTKMEDLPKGEKKTLAQTLEEDAFSLSDWEEGNGEARVGNCQGNTLAYELQRRGYNVEAGLFDNSSQKDAISSVPSSYGEIHGDKSVDAAFDALVKKSGGMSSYDVYGAKPSDTYYFETRNDLMTAARRDPTNYPPGARGFVEMQGHISNWEIDPSGKMVFVDGQIGGATGDLTTDNSEHMNREGLRVLRTDNREINEEALKYVRAQNDVIDALNYTKATLEYPEGWYEDQGEEVAEYMRRLETHYQDEIDDRLEELEKEGGRSK